MTIQQLMDRWGRKIDNLRISVIDRCNLRCQYCMPIMTALTFSEKSEILTYEEIFRIARVVTVMGIRTIRLTGGEPLLRRQLVKLVGMLSSLKGQGLKSIKMTTNGIYLSKHAKDLKIRGLDAVNVSLDTLNPHKFEKITGFPLLDQVIEGIEEALNVGFREVKVNAVAIKGFNDDEILDFAEFAIKHGITVRFIEFMPFPGNGWSLEKFIPSSDLRKKLERRYQLELEPLTDLSQTSRNYRIVGTEGKIGFISSVSESFCSTCSRMRLSADGKLQPCLHGKEEIDLKTVMRNNGTDDDIRRAFLEAAGIKSRGHEDFLSPKFTQPTAARPMIRIGG